MKCGMQTILITILVLCLVPGTVLARSQGEIRQEMDLMHRQYMQAVAAGNETDIQLFGDLYRQLQDEFARAGGGETAAAPAALSVRGSSAGIDDLHETIVALQQLDPSILERPADRGLFSRIFAGVRRLFGAPSEEDLVRDAFAALDRGEYARARNAFQDLLARNPSSLKYRYQLAMAQMGEGDIDAARTTLGVLKESIAETKYEKVLHSITDPYVRERVAFKISGFDSIEQYREKVLAGNKLELHSDEYFAKYVNPRTWNYYSDAARREFESIGGIDCGGLCQRVYMSLCEKAGLKAPFSSKLPGEYLKKPQYSKRLNEDGGIPPKSARPGDIMFLSKHDGWGHVFIFDGWNSQGQPMIIEASGEGYCMRRPMPDRYYHRYDGTYRWNQMDEIKKRLGEA